MSMLVTKSCLSFAKALVANTRVPIIVSWNITYRCNLKCNYCGTNQPKGYEANAEVVLKTASRLRSLGAKFVGFSGGEPLVREDFPDIVRACKSLGMKVSLQTNGILVPRFLEKVNNIDEIRVSMDGPSDVMEALRGPGTFEAAVSAIKACQTKGVKVYVTAVLTSESIKTLPAFLEILKGLRVGAYFQPMAARFAPPIEPSHPLWPKPESLCAAIDLLVRMKKQNPELVLNSEAGLRYMQDWPKERPLRCIASRFMCTVSPEAKVFICDMYPGFEALLEEQREDLGRQLSEMKLPMACPRCITGAMVDLNLAASANLGAFLAVFKRLFSLLFM